MGLRGIVGVAWSESLSMNCYCTAGREVTSPRSLMAWSMHANRRSQTRCDQPRWNRPSENCSYCSIELKLDTPTARTLPPARSSLIAPADALTGVLDPEHAGNRSMQVIQIDVVRSHAFHRTVTALLDSCGHSPKNPRWPAKIP